MHSDVVGDVREQLGSGSYHFNYLPKTVSLHLFLSEDIFILTYDLSLKLLSQKWFFLFLILVGSPFSGVWFPCKEGRGKK